MLSLLLHCLPFCHLLRFLQLLFIIAVLRQFICHVLGHHSPTELRSISNFINFSLSSSNILPHDNASRACSTAGEDIVLVGYNSASIMVSSTLAMKVACSSMPFCLYMIGICFILTSQLSSWHLLSFVELPCGILPASNQPYPGKPE